MFRLVLALWLAHTADIITTIDGIGRGFVELNPLYVNASTPELLAIKALSTMSITLIALFAYRRGRIIEAKACLWLTILFGAGAAVWNTYVMHTM